MRSNLPTTIEPAPWIGVGRAEVSAPPPSKPDRRVSRIRLSSRWVLRREGAALRLVPKRVGQTFGITQANCTRLIPPLASPHGHSRWFSFPSFCPSHFHLPASLGSTVVTRFSATTDALTPAGQARGLWARFALQHRRVSLVTSLGLPAIPSPTISVSSGDRPAVRRFGSSPIVRSTGFASRSKARPSTPTESSSRRTAQRPPCVTDWSFSFRCSPPRVATTQFRFHTARFFTAQEQTSTALSQRLPRRTSAGLRPGVFVKSLAMFGRFLMNLTWPESNSPHRRPALRSKKARRKVPAPFGSAACSRMNAPGSGRSRCRLRFAAWLR